MNINDTTHATCDLADFVQSPAKPVPLQDGQVLLVVGADGISLEAKYFAHKNKWVTLD